MIYDAKRITGFNVSLVIMFTIVLSAQSFITMDYEYGLRVFIATGIASLICIATYFSKLSNRIKGYVTCGVPFILCYLLGYKVGAIGNYLNTIFITFCMAALYFRVEGILVHGIIANMVLIASAIFLPDKTYEVMGLKEFI